MANQRDATQTFDVTVIESVQCDVSALDFAGYTYSGTYITNPVYCALQATDMPRSSTSFYQSSVLPIGNRDFILKFRMKATKLEEAPANTVGAMFSTMLTKYQSTTNHQSGLDAWDGIVFSFREYTGANGVEYVFQTRSRTHGYLGSNCNTYQGTCDGNSDCCRELIGALNTNYLITITRVGTTITTDIYDETNSAVIGSYDITDYDHVYGTNTDVQYLVPMCGRGQASTYDEEATGAVWDFTLTYQVQNQFENFLNYPDFVTDGVNITRTASTISFTGMSLNSTPYCRRLYPFSTTNFNLWMTVDVDMLQAACPQYYGGHVLIATFTRDPASTSWDIFNYSYGNKDGITLRVGCWTNDAGENQHFLRFHNNQDDSSPDTWVFQWSGTTTPRSFVINMIQSGTTVTTTIYDPSDLITPLHTFTHTAVSNATPYQHFLPFCSMSVPTRIPPNCTVSCTLPCATSTGAVYNYEFV